VCWERWSKLDVTSRSNSSGPARGSKRYGSASIPGAVGLVVVLFCKIEICSESGLRIALCAVAKNAQFLCAIFVRKWR
jgi:hypothetical protein